MTDEQLAKELNLPSAHFVKELRRNKKITALKLGYKTFRYDPERVRADLKKLEVKAV